MDGNLPRKSRRNFEDRPPQRRGARTESSFPQNYFLNFLLPNILLFLFYFFFHMISPPEEIHRKWPRIIIMMMKMVHFSPSRHRGGSRKFDFCPCQTTQGSIDSKENARSKVSFSLFRHVRIGSGFSPRMFGGMARAHSEVHEGFGWEMSCIERKPVGKVHLMQIQTGQDGKTMSISWE